MDTLLQLSCAQCCAWYTIRIKWTHCSNFCWKGGIHLSSLLSSRITALPLFPIQNLYWSLVNRSWSVRFRDGKLLSFQVFWWMQHQQFAHFEDWLELLEALEQLDWGISLWSQHASQLRKAWYFFRTLLCGGKSSWMLEPDTMHSDEWAIQSMLYCLFCCVCLVSLQETSGVV